MKLSLLYNYVVFIIINVVFISIVYLILLNRPLEPPNKTIFFCMYYVFTSILFLYLYKWTDKKDILSPTIGIVVLLFLYSLSSAIFVEYNQVTNFGDTINSIVMNKYYLSCMMGLFGFASGTLWVKYANIRLISIPRSIMFRIRNEVILYKLLIYSILFCSIFFIYIRPYFDFINVRSYAERALSMRVEWMEVLSSGPKEVLLVYIPITFAICTCVLIFFRQRNIFLKIFSVIIMLSYLITNTLAGWRGVVISALLIPTAYYHYKIKRISIATATVAGLIVYIFMATLSVARSTSKPMEMLDLARVEILEQGFKSFALSSSGELLVGTNLMRLISGIDNKETDFTFGSSMISETLLFIPRVIYPKRQLSLGERFVDTFYPGILEAGGGYGFFILQEGYWSFGVVGIFVFMLIFGGILEYMYQVYLKYIDYDYAVLCYGVAYNSIVLSSVRSGIIGSFKGMIIGLLPLIILIALPYYKNKKQ